MHYAGYYLNLDRDVDRRRMVEDQLAAFNLRHVYQRFPAAQGNVLNVQAPKLSPGAVGCFTSHYQLLKSLLPAPGHIHVVEDDVLFSPNTGRVIESVLGSGGMDNWDLLYTDIWLPVDLAQIREFNTLLSQNTTLAPNGTMLAIKQFSLINLEGRAFAATSSYLVNQRSLPKIVDLLAAALAAGLTLPIDLFYRREISQGRLKAACLFPFVTSVNVEQSLLTNITDRNDTHLQRSILTSNLLRNLFFIQGDPSKLRQLADEHLGLPATDDRAKVLAAVTRFASSPAFKSY